jgi:hypothetical protein
MPKVCAVFSRLDLRGFSDGICLVHRWLQQALREENKSRNFNQKPYEVQIADVQNRFATAETGVAALERLVHVLDGEKGLDEESNKNKLANNAK